MDLDQDTTSLTRGLRGMITWQTESRGSMVRWRHCKSLSLVGCYAMQCCQKGVPGFVTGTVLVCCLFSFLGNISKVRGIRMEGRKLIIGLFRVFTSPSILPSHHLFLELTLARIVFYPVWPRGCFTGPPPHFHQCQGRWLPSRWCRLQPLPSPRPQFPLHSRSQCHLRWGHFWSFIPIPAMNLHLRCGEDLLFQGREWGALESYGSFGSW